MLKPPKTGKLVFLLATALAVISFAAFVALTDAEHVCYDNEECDDFDYDKGVWESDENEDAL